MNSFYVLRNIAGSQKTGPLVQVVKECSSEKEAQKIITISEEKVPSNSIARFDYSIVQDIAGKSFRTPKRTVKIVYPERPAAGDNL